MFAPFIKNIFIIFEEVKMKKHITTFWGENSPAAYVSNGFIGFRFNKDPFKKIIGMLSGFYSQINNNVEAFAIIPTPNFTFSVDGNTIEPETIKQEYDFSCGEFTTFAILDINGEKVELEYRIFTSRTSPTLLMAELVAKSDTELKIKADIEYKIHYKRLEYTVAEAIECEYNGEDFDGKFRLPSSDGLTSAGIAYKIYGQYQNKERISTKKISFEFTSSNNGTKIQLITSYVPEIMHSEPHNQAQRMIKLATWNTYDRLRMLNQKAWAKLWESRITIEGANPEWQNVIDASYFYLMSSASAFSPCSIAPYGLSQPEAYEGHCFWDTESFMFITPLFTAPDVAQNILDYRFKRIDAAKANAKLNGYRGIQFPWQSGTTGSEVTAPWAGQAGGAGEQHVNLDVALAFDAYVKVSGDDVFLKEKAWPVMNGVAEWIESRVEKTDRGYEILHVTGIDEETDNVQNDSYTNILSIKILNIANEYREKLGMGTNKKWKDIADNMFIASRPDGVLPQYEGMPDSDEQASTVLMSHFPYGYTSENDKVTFEYYINNGMREYLQYPMLSGFLGLFPLWAGDRKKGLEFYERSNLDFFCDPFYACVEWAIPDPEERRNPKNYQTTSFITARGSLLSGLIMGLTKMCPWRGHVDGDITEWLGRDIVLPEGWESVTLHKVYLRGKAYKITAKHGAECAEITELAE